jgi:type VI secretion system secreted protein Hcp
MAVRMVLKIDGVDGESKLDGHQKEIDIISWKWGLKQDGTMHRGGGGSGGTVSVDNLMVSKYVDKATPGLIRACCNGENFSEATLTMRKMGKDPLDYLKTKMSPVIVVSVKNCGNETQESLTEDVTFNFAKVEVTYTPQKDDGTADAEVLMNWNIEFGKEE